MKRVIFYFDGFNFYNGLKEKSDIDKDWKNYYWLDFISFCQQFIGRESVLEEVKYFTAPPSNPSKRSRQAALFSANKLLHNDRFIIINGQYQNKTTNCRLCNRDFITPEEKRTDVSIAVHMLMDCVKNRADTLILISADSDQIPTIQCIKSDFPDKTVKVYFPPCRNSTEIFSICKPIVFLGENEEKFKKSVMKHTVEGNGKKYTCPPNWKH